MQIVSLHSSQARSVHMGLEETVPNLYRLYMRTLGSTVTGILANALTLNINFTNGNTSIKADFS